MIGSHSVSARDFALLAAGGGDGDTIRALADGEFSRRLLLLQAVRETAPGTSAVTQAFTLLNELQRKRPDVVRFVLTLPAVGIWAVACLRDGDAASYPYLNCLAATAALLADADTDIEVPVWDGAVFLPALGSMTLGTSAGSARLRSRGGQPAIVETGTGTIPLAEGAGWRPVRQLNAEARGLRLRVWLEDAGPFRGPEGVRLAAPLTEAQAASWERVLGPAWELLARRHRQQAAGIAAGLRVLTPMAAQKAGASMSVTVADGFGALLLTPPADPRSLALTLLHEAQHSKLAALHHVLPLHTDDPRPRWYAPWRDDPRPLNGLLHGSYAHLGVAAFWQGALRDGDPDAAEELAYWHNAVTEALGQLTASGQLTAAGARFATGMAAGLTRLDTRQAPRPARDRAAERGIWDRMTWRMRHLRPDPAVTDELARAWLTGAPPARAPEVTLRPGERGPIGSLRPPAEGADLVHDPDEPAAWVRLALTLREPFLIERPELVRAIALRVRELTGDTAEPAALTRWTASLGPDDSLR